MMRESELQEMEKKWREENARIMAEHPAVEGWTPATTLPGPEAMNPDAYGDALPTGTDETAPGAPLAPSAAEEEMGEQDPRNAPPRRQPGEELP
jgi:sec-independent protein translocase protein TatB